MLTVEEAATKWRVSQARVRQWLKDKRIKGANKFGRDWQIPNKAARPKPLNMSDSERRKMHIIKAHRRRRTGVP